MNQAGRNEEEFLVVSAACKALFLPRAVSHYTLGIIYHAQALCCYAHSEIIMPKNVNEITIIFMPMRSSVQGGERESVSIRHFLDNVVVP